MRVDVVTLFPELFGPFLATSMVARACEQGVLDVALVQLREHGLGRHRSVDDTPYGGGSGMVLRVDVVAACLDAVDAVTLDERGRPLEAAHRVLLTPQGRPLRQGVAIELSRRPRVALICGRYEGFDERVRGLVHEEISLGDFVLTGGEIAAMAILEATVRMLPGVLGNAASASEESHSPVTGGLLEYPQYTRPLEFRGERVPEALLSGHHAQIAAWRRARSLERTRDRRPDLLAREREEASK